MTSNQEKFDKAQQNEAKKSNALAKAALDYAKAQDLQGSADARETLQAAAKAWTNAMHQTSRCAKHLRDAGGEV